MKETQEQNDAKDFYRCRNELEESLDQLSNKRKRVALSDEERESYGLLMEEKNVINDLINEATRAQKNTGKYQRGTGSAA